MDLVVRDMNKIYRLMINFFGFEESSQFFVVDHFGVVVFLGGRCNVEF